ncbi:DMT family transporter [Nisaea sp.]|uniref:DMT family transporter n=1 Tax=Nisaea sp. TaxID=2024842 RepID=UPI00329796F9
MTGLSDDSGAIRRGITLMIAGIFVVSVMDALIKWLTASYPSIQIVMLRCLFGLIPLFVIVCLQGGLAVLRTARPGAQLLRSAFGAGAMLGFFYALSVLGLAETVTLAFSSPLFVTLLSVPVLGERVGARRLGAVIVGFIGVVIVVRPGAEIFKLDSLIPIAASFCFAMTMLLARRLSVTETSVSMTFYTTLTGLSVGTAGVLWVVGTSSGWAEPQPADWGLFLLLGLLGGVGQYLVTTSFRHAEAVVVAPFEYSALIWATLFGFVIWKEVPDGATLLGGIIVIGAGLYIGYRETRLGKKTEGPGAMPGPSP